jgi:hypothetical protein
MNKAAPLALLLFLAFSLSGCATALYMKGKPTDWKLQTWVQAAPLKSSAPYLSATLITTRVDRYMDAPNDVAYIGSLLMEFTPFGLAAPLFGYPDIIDQELIGSIALKLSQTVEDVTVEGGVKRRDSITFDIPTNGTGFGTHTIRLHLSGSSSVKVTPSLIEFNISYNNKTCSCEASPSIVSDDGTIQIITEP